jgi:hypothetical protein
LTCLHARSPRPLHKTTAAREDTAASPSGNSNKFVGERKGPPEEIVPAPEAVAVPRLPTLWEWTPPSGVGGELKGPPEAIVPGPEDTMPSMVAHDFAADRDAHDFAADRDVAAALPRRTSRRYPMVAGEEGKHDGGVNNDDGYDSFKSVDDDRDGDFVPKAFEYSDDDDDFDHLLDDDDINDEDRRIVKMDSKSRIPTGRRRGNIIPGGPVAPN